jgi:hypothetical protein
MSMRGEVDVIPATARSFVGDTGLTNSFTMK